MLLGGRDLALGEAAAALRAGGHDARSLALDVTDPASVPAAAAPSTDQYGRLDILVNNAGIAAAPPAAAAQ